jgi:hypothetical protein
VASFLNPDLTYDRKAVAREARRIARRGAHIVTPGAWQRIAWGKARDERNRMVAGWLTLRLALALARGDDPTISLLDTLSGIDSRRRRIDPGDAAHCLFPELTVSIRRHEAGRPDVRRAAFALRQHLETCQRRDDIKP